MTEKVCPCGSGKDYLDCCGRLILNQGLPETAEQLMRSRYTAFTQNNFPYLEATYHPDTSQPYDTESNRELVKNFDWIGLEILSTENGQAHDSEGYVDFVARYKAAGSIHAIREKSHFKKLGDRWLYVSGKSLALPKKNDTKVGRNDPCPCGSGKKYKKCCGA